MNMPHVSMARMVPVFSARRVRMMLLVALLGSVFVEQSSALFVFERCRGVMGNREIYDRVNRVCDDCYNIFRDEDLAVNCRKNCFSNNEFYLCLLETERDNEIDEFRQHISRIRDGRK